MTPVKDNYPKEQWMSSEFCDNCNEPVASLRAILIFSEACLLGFVTSSIHSSGINFLWCLNFVMRNDSAYSDQKVVPRTRDLWLTELEIQIQTHSDAQNSGFYFVGLRTDAAVICKDRNFLNCGFKLIFRSTQLITINSYQK